MNGNGLVFTPCTSCRKTEMCATCELTGRRIGVVMARYIDMEELKKRIRDNVLSDDNATPYDMDLIEWCKDECIRQGYAMPIADVVPRGELAQLVREIFDEVENCVVGTIEPSFIQLRDKYIAKMQGGE